jgi:hypothetical protein
MPPVYLHQVKLKIMKKEKIPQATVTGSYGYGWQQMWKHFLYLFLVIVVVTIAHTPVSIIQEYDSVSTAGMVILQILAAAFLLLFIPVISFGSDLLFLRGMRNEKIEVQEIFGGFKKNYLNIILANLLTFAIVGLGFAFLIIPGIILACRLSFVSLLVMDKNMDPVAAVEKSWEMTKGYGWTIFGIAIMAIPVFIGGILFFIVGALFAIIWISAAFTSLYHAVDLEDKKKLNGDTIEPETTSE